MAAAKGGAKEPVARAVTKEAAAAPPAAAAATKPKGGLWKPVPVSPAMRKFLGVQEIARMEAVKKIWEHIKANQLQVRAPPSPMFFFPTLCLGFEKSINMYLCFVAFSWILLSCSVAVLCYSRNLGLAHYL